MSQLSEIEDKPLKGKFRKLIVYLFYFSLSAGLMSLGYLKFYKLQQELEQMHNLAAINSIEMTKLKHLVEPLSALNLEQQLNKIDANFQQAEQKLKKETHQIENNFLIREVEYLIQLASHQLSLNQDIGRSKVLLLAAEERLSAYQKAELLPIKAALAQSIDNIGKLPSVDFELEWMNFQQAIQLVDGLIFKIILKDSSSLEPIVPSIEASRADESANWSGKFHQGLKQIFDLVKIKRHQTIIPPLLDSVEQLLIKERIKLLIEQSRWAMLHQQTLIFNRSLADLKVLCQKWFNLETTQVKEFLSKIDAFNQLTLNLKLGDLLHQLQGIEQSLASTTS